MALTLVARVGRHKQLYDEHSRRLVAGCIPYKVIENCTGDLEDKLEVLMISSPNRADYIFPKGGWEDDETASEAATREALEEAGVRGMIRASIGTWVFRSKSRQNSCTQEGSCVGHMFAMEVTEELENWPEKCSHQRKWVKFGEAKQFCRYDWMKEALDAWKVLLLGEQSSSAPNLSDALSYSYVQPAVSEQLVDSPINAFG